jgi:hypothetical protein
LALGFSEFYNKLLTDWNLNDAVDIFHKALSANGKNDDTPPYKASDAKDAAA